VYRPDYAIPLVLCGFLAAAAPLRAQDCSWVETFDDGGTDFSQTRLPDLQLSGDGTFEQAALTTGQGAPNTSPNLPVNAAGDFEGRYFEDGVSTAPSLALTEDVAQNAVEHVHLECIVGIGSTGAGASSAGLVARVSGVQAADDYDAYVLYLYHDSGNEAQLILGRIRDGVIDQNDAYAISDDFTVDLSEENYRLEFDVRGNTLMGRIWRQETTGGFIEENPIDLDDANGNQYVLTATDTELWSGRVGFRAEAHGTNSVFLEAFDYEEYDCPPVPTFCFGGSPGFTCPCGNPGLAGRGCNNSALTGGAQIQANGTPRIGGDTLVLSCNGLPPGVMGLYFQGALQIGAGAGIPFGDGRLCAGGQLARLKPVPADGLGFSSYGHPNHSVSERAGIFEPGTYYYQVWYRDTKPFCMEAEFNTSSAVAVTWLPPLP